VNVGYLEIRMPRAAALCMWKVDLDGSIKATVNITYEDGSTPSIATVNGKRIGDDYLIISTGFHYSSPTLRVKLSQDNAVKPAENSVSAQSENKDESKVAAPAIAAKKIKVINCVKGKLKRKISGVNPKCPAGFVKK
jgi:hypothetical protein